MRCSKEVNNVQLRSFVWALWCSLHGPPCKTQTRAPKKYLPVCIASQMCEQPVLPQDLNFSFPVQVSLCECGSNAALEPKTNQDQLWNRTQKPSGGEIRWEKGQFVYPSGSVDVGGPCFRNIQISLFKILWSLTWGTDKKTLAWTWTRLGMCNRALLCFTSQIQSLAFSTLSAAFLFAPTHTHTKRRTI